MAKKIGVIGAGPGGLAAAVLLRAKGFDVDVFEAAPEVGGRNARLSLGDYHFDTGPTFFLMPEILEGIFSACGRSLSDYLKLKRVDPLYRLCFGDGSALEVPAGAEDFRRAIARFSLADANRYPAFRDRQRSKFEALRPALSKPFAGWLDLADVGNLPVLPHLNAASVYDELATWFEDERVRLAFTFQAKYLGMSPFECPSLFTILPHLEHENGVWHPLGGCSEVSRALARLFVELGGRLHLSTPVRSVDVQQGRARGLVTDSGLNPFDYCVMNADFAHGMTELVSEKARAKYTDAKLERLRYSCSTFMMYLGLSERVELPHHSIWFAQNYRRNVREICTSLELSNDPSFYLHNPSVTDPTLAPEGKSALYVLVPVPNLDAKIDWETNRSSFRELVLTRIRERTGLDLAPLIEKEKIITPLDWERDHRVYKGATFSLAHSWDQMLQFRPRNEFEEFRGFYLVGGGTHPGSGLPTILESARIAASLIDSRERRSWRRPLALWSKETS